MVNSEARSAEGVVGGREVSGGWRSLALALALVAIMTLLGSIIGGFVAPVNLVMLYLAAVVIAAMYLGRRASILTALVSVVVFDFFLVPPRHTFAVADTQYLLTFAGLLIVGLVVSSLTSEARDQANAARSREAQAVALYKFGRDLSCAEEEASILSAVVLHVSQTFDRHAAVFLPSPDKEMAVASSSADFHPTDDHVIAAGSALELNQATAQGAERHQASDMWCLPLRTPRGIVGVLGVAPVTGDRRLSEDHCRLLETFASQAALAIERAHLAERDRQAHLVAATEKLYSALLHSISHDLRTPLVTITGAFSALETSAGHLDEAARTSLAHTGREEAERLNHLVGNLLDMTRIEAGALKLTEELADVGEAIAVVLDRLGDQLKDRPVRVEIPADLPAAPMDMPLVVNALANIVDNAIKYSPAGSPLDIRAGQVGESVRVEIADRGEGIPTDELSHVFERFYRVNRRDGIKGTGLGLAISKGIIEAHGGTIAAGHRPGGGTVVTIDLPLEKSALTEV